MDHADEIENDFNLIKFAHQIHSGDCRYTKLAWLLAKFIRLAGGEATQKQVWDEMFGKGQTTPPAALEMGKALVAACLPAIPEESAAKKKSTKKKLKK